SSSSSSSVCTPLGQPIKVQHAPAERSQDAGQLIFKRRDRRSAKPEAAVAAAAAARGASRASAVRGRRRLRRRFGNRQTTEPLHHLPPAVLAFGLRALRIGRRQARRFQASDEEAKAAGGKLEQRG